MDINQKPDPTMEALNRKRGAASKGLDITLTIGGDPENPDVSVNGNPVDPNESSEIASGKEPMPHGLQPDQNEEELEDKTDLAPSPSTEESPNKPAPGQLVDSGTSPQEMSGIDNEMLGQMPPHDQADLMNRKPRSLGEAARQAAMNRQKPKG